MKMMEGLCCRASSNRFLTSLWRRKVGLAPALTHMPSRGPGHHFSCPRHEEVKTIAMLGFQEKRW